MMNILLTGGAGYIGSHTTIVLSEAGHNIIMYDNFCNSKQSILDRVNLILKKNPVLVEGDIRDTEFLLEILHNNKIDLVVHLAGLKAVGDSTKKPIDYYANNVQGTISLLQAMNMANVKRLIFSSSATVYGDPQYLPIDEKHPLSPTNAYGQSKLHIEEMLKDVSISDSEWQILCLRYFNPVGAHKSGLLGEDPNGIPSNLMPLLAQVAAGKLPQINIYGNDYDTPDGTGVRDYIHVMDLADGHLAALKALNSYSGWQAVNLGAGRGYSVLEMIAAFEAASGAVIPSKQLSRRLGDVAMCFAGVNRAKNFLSWEAKRGLNEMVSDSWRWQQFRETWP